MNRAERRRAMRLGGRPGMVTGGPLVEAKHKYGAELSAPPGEHLWIVTGAYRVNPATFMSEQVFMDLENLLSIDGPGCFVCMQVWHEGISDVCPGDPEL